MCLWELLLTKDYCRGTEHVTGTVFNEASSDMGRETYHPPVPARQPLVVPTLENGQPAAVSTSAVGCRFTGLVQELQIQSKDFQSCQDMLCRHVHVQLPQVNYKHVSADMSTGEGSALQACGARFPP